MEEQHRSILINHRIFLLKNLFDVHIIVEHLYAGGVITENEKDMVFSKFTPEEKRSFLLDLLPRKGPNAFEVFLKALKAEKCGFIADTLTNSLSQHETQARGELQIQVASSQMAADGSQLEQLIARNRSSLEQVLNAIDSHLQALTAQATQLKEVAVKKSSNIEEELRGLSANQINTQHRDLLNSAQTDSLLNEPVLMASHIKFVPASELILGKLDVAMEFVKVPPASTSTPQQQPDHMQDLPAKPRSVMQVDFKGRIGFFPERHLLCLVNDGSGYLISACEGSIIEKYNTNITTAVYSVAVSRSKVAVTHDYTQSAHTNKLKLINRNANDIHFSDALDVENLNGPDKCAFTRAGHLIVSEWSTRSVAILDENGKVMKRIDLELKPFHIALNHGDSSFYVTDYESPLIHHFKYDGSEFKCNDVLECKDKNDVTFKPFGIAVDNRRLFVADEKGNRILQRIGDRFVEWINEEDGVKEPWGIAMNGSGQFAVYSYRSRLVRLYDMTNNEC